MISLSGKGLAAQFYSFYFSFSWGFYYYAGLLFCTKKYRSLPLMGYK